MNWCSAISFGFVAILLGFVLDTLRIAGEFKTISDLNNIGCSRHALDYNALEDGALYGDYLFFSSDHRDRFLSLLWPKDYEGSCANLTESGTILFFDLKKNFEPEPLTLVDFPHQHFHPLGINIWPPFSSQEQPQPEYLYATNWNCNLSAVEVFKIDLPNRSLKYLTTVSSPTMRFLNDIAPVSARYFYTTNWLYYAPGSRMNAVELLSRAAWGSILFCEISTDWSSSSCSIVVASIQGPNGITASPDFRYLAVNSLSVYLFRRDLTNQSLTLLGQALVRGHADNSAITQQGDLYVTAHPKALTFSAHARNHSKLSPSQVFRINLPRWISHIESHPSAEISYLEPQVIFQSVGADLSAASVCLPYNNQMILGSVHSHGIMVCPLPGPSNQEQSQ